MKLGLREIKNKNRTFADLARFVKRSPSWPTYILPITVILTIDLVLIKSLIVVALGILGSYILVILLDLLFVKFTDFVFPLRRILFLNFISLLIWSVFFWILYVIRAFADIESLLMISISSIALLRVLIFYAYYSEKISRAIVPSLSYTFSAVLVLTVAYHDLQTVIPFIISSAIYVIAGIIFVRDSTKKFAEEYGEHPTNLIKFFLNYHSSEEHRKVGEQFFYNMYKHARKVPVKIIDVINKEEKRKALLVFPYVHPGPFGTMGSSNLPIRLQNRLSDIGSDLMVFHTTTTNSNNCSGDRDMDSIAEGVREAMANLDYVDTFSRFKKLSSGKYVIGIQKFGDYGFGAVIPEKEPFDDVELKEGMKIMHSVAKAGAKDFAVIDGQNFFKYGAPELDDCSSMESSFAREFERLQSKFPARIGYSRLTSNVPELGVMGIQTLVMDVGGKHQAIVLTDSNNVTTDLIELVRQKAQNEASTVEIYTTDNHFTNATTLDMNPLGSKGDIEGIANTIVESIAKGKEDIEDVKIGMASSTVKVYMGDDNSFQKLINSVFSSVRRAKYTIMITIPSSVIASILIFRFMMPLI